MNQSYKEKLLRINDELIDEASEVMKSQFKTGIIGAPTFVESQIFFKWWGKVKSFGYQLGTASKPWQELFAKDPERSTLMFVKQALGTLEAIKNELANDHLDTFTYLIRAETFADLLEQAEHLLSNGYYLAAGVIGRAILEEHLRSICDTIGCTPSKERSTINDFNQALYGVQHYSKTKMKHIDVLASIGNDAAHNKPDLDSVDVRKLLLDLPEVIESTNV